MTDPTDSPPTPPRTALLVGASGLVGGKLLDRLLADGAWSRVVLLVRRPTGRTDPRIEEIVVDFDDLEAHAGRFAVADVFCCLGTTLKRAGSQQAFRRVDQVYPVALARLAHAARADRFLVLSSLGAAPAARSFYLRVKGEMERSLGRIGLRSLLIFRPSFLLGERAEPRPLETFVTGFLRGLWWLMIGPLGRYRPIAADRVAEAMLNASKADASGARVFESDAIRSLSKRPRS